jgi:hypothetical protein
VVGISSWEMISCIIYYLFTAKNDN